MAVPTNRTTGQTITAADINGIASLANKNETAVTLKSGRAFTKRTVTGPYTLVALDAYDKILHSTAATAVTITLPQDSAANIPQEVAIPWRQYGLGQLTFAQGAGATILSRGKIFKNAAQYAEGYVTKTAANTWVVSGDIVA